MNTPARTQPPVSDEELDAIETRMQKPLNEWPAYDDDNPALSWSVEDRIVRRLIATLRREREIRRALPEYLPIRYYPGSADVPVFYTCQACNEQGESARSVAHPADCPWRALLALDEGVGE